MNLFDRTEIQSAIATINDEKTKLEALYQELWDIFDGIDRNETSANVWQERLREYDLRRDFYESCLLLPRWWTFCIPAMSCLNRSVLSELKCIAKITCSSKTERQRDAPFQ